MRSMTSTGRRPLKRCDARRSAKGCDRGAHALSREGTWRTKNSRKCRRARRNRNGFRRRALRDIPEVNAFIASQTALGRAGVPDDIGPVVAALLSPSHRWINAQRIEVSGGCRTHESLRRTPAMALGITDRVWTIGDLIDAALAKQPIKPETTAPDRRKRFTVIDGGRA
jgi:hypothetical protein